MDWGRIGPRLDVRPLFVQERELLLELLRELPAEAWRRPTVCPGWSVHDLIGHLVHDYVRRLSGHRDEHTTARVVPDGDLARAVHRANEDFVLVSRGLSSRVLTDLVAHLGPQLDDLWAGLDLDGLGGSVSWVAPDVAAPHWLDVARELSEFWVHQQQVRDAVGRPGAREPELLTAVVDIFVRSLPRALDPTPAGAGSTLTLEVDVGDAGVVAWTAMRDDQGWRLERRGHPDPGARVSLPVDTFWRLATRGVDPAGTLPTVRLEGDRALGEASLHLLSIIR